MFDRFPDHAPVSSAPSVVTAPPGSGRIIYIDVLKILAIVGVMVMHAAGQFFLNGRNAEKTELETIVFFMTMAGYCIPIFVMCSGAMLLSRKAGTPLLPFYTKRLPRIFIPLLFWSVVYFVYDSDLSNFSAAQGTHFLTLLLTGKIKAFLWFLYMLLGVYLSAPFLRMIVDRASRPALWCLTLLCLVPNAIEQTVKLSIELDLGMHDSIFRIYVGYFLLGYLLHTAKPLRRRGQLGLASLYGLIVAASGYLQWFLLVHFPPKPPINLLSYASCNMVIMSAAVFLLVRSQDFSRLTPWARPIATLANATYGIYLVHVLVQSLLQRGILGFPLLVTKFSPSVGIVVCSLTIYAISLALVLLFKNIPLLRQSIGYRSPQPRPVDPFIKIQSA